MNNRIKDLELPQKSARAEADPTGRPKIDLEGSLAVVTQWAEQHPFPCLAAAFLFGGAIAWIIKRR